MHILKNPTQAVLTFHNKVAKKTARNVVEANIEITEVIGFADDARRQFGEEFQLIKLMEKK